jgi:hypothetical protein
MNNMTDIKKMPVIGTLITKVIKMEVIGDSSSKPYLVPAETYEIVDSHIHNGKTYYITNVWHKEYKKIPLIIVEDIVEKYEPVSKV